MKRPGAVAEQMEGRKEGGRERVMAGGKTERVEKLMSRLLCDGACLFQCQAAFLHTHLKTLFFPSLLLVLFSSFLFLRSLSQFLALSLADSAHHTGTTVHHKKGSLNCLPKFNFQTTIYTIEPHQQSKQFGVAA